MTEVNHCLSKWLVESKLTAFVVEGLSGTRKRTGEAGKGSNRWRKSISSRSFHQLGFFLAYKAETAGKRASEADPKRTSQECSCCGYMEKANRHGPSFVCL